MTPDDPTPARKKPAPLDDDDVLEPLPEGETADLREAVKHVRRGGAPMETRVEVREDGDAEAAPAPPSGPSETSPAVDPEGYFRPDLAPAELEDEDLLLFLDEDDEAEFLALIGLPRKRGFLPKAAGCLFLLLLLAGAGFALWWFVLRDKGA